MFACDSAAIELVIAALKWYYIQPLQRIRCCRQLSFTSTICGGLTMSSNRYLRVCCYTAALLFVALALSMVLSSQSRADESSCITCHTDEDLLTENLGTEDTKKSPLQAGGG